MVFRLVVAAPLLARLARLSLMPAVKVAVMLEVVAIAAPVAALVASLTVALESEPITTLEAGVTRAAVSSAEVPVTV